MRRQTRYRISGCRAARGEHKGPDQLRWEKFLMKITVSIGIATCKDGKDMGH